MLGSLSTSRKKARSASGFGLLMTQCAPMSIGGPPLGGDRRPARASRFGHAPIIAPARGLLREGNRLARPGGPGGPRFPPSEAVFDGFITALCRGGSLGSEPKRTLRRASDKRDPIDDDSDVPSWSVRLLRPLVPIVAAAPSCLPDP